MRQENYNFFQEFNRVDKLCRDLMKAEQQGVTAYLNCMEENWQADAGLKDGCMGTGRSFWRLVATAAVMTAAAMAVMMLLIWLLLG